MTNAEKIALYKAGDQDESGSMEWGEFQRCRFRRLRRESTPSPGSHGHK